MVLLFSHLIFRLMDKMSQQASSMMFVKHCHDLCPLSLHLSETYTKTILCYQDLYFISLLKTFQLYKATQPLRQNKSWKHIIFQSIFTLVSIHLKFIANDGHISNLKNSSFSLYATRSLSILLMFVMQPVPRPVGYQFNLYSFFKIYFVNKVWRYYHISSIVGIVLWVLNVFVNNI